MNEFEKQLLGKLIDHLGLEEIDMDTTNSETRLFSEGLELDSIDIIEIEVMIKKEFHIDVLPSERTPEVYGSLGSLARFIEQNRDRDA